MPRFSIRDSEKPVTAAGTQLNTEGGRGAVTPPVPGVPEGKTGPSGLTLSQTPPRRGKRKSMEQKSAMKSARLST